jgi:hypothetical protein
MRLPSPFSHLFSVVFSLHCPGPSSFLCGHLEDQGFSLPSLLCIPVTVPASGAKQWEDTERKEAEGIPSALWTQGSLVRLKVGWSVFA